MENPIEMDDLGVPLFLETPIYTLAHLLTSSEIKHEQDQMQQALGNKALSKSMVKNGYTANMFSQILKKYQLEQTSILVVWF